MYPNKYSEVPCTCEQALALVNQKLMVEEKGPIRYTYLTFWKSATAPWVKRAYPAGWSDVRGRSSPNYSVGPDYDDPDL